MPSIDKIISNISNQKISLFFENKITSFKPEKDVFTNTVNKETPYSNPIKIGHAELKNYEELLVFTCEYNKELTARSAKKQQFEIAKKVLKKDFKDGAIFIFYDAQSNFRFSFIRRNYGEKGNKKYSNWKRYTYYVTPSEPNRTFKERIDNCDFTSLNTIQEAFSVEKLTKQFYNELFAWYQWALSDEVGITYPNNTKTSDDDRVQLEEQVIRLITRLLFVWFIKQKQLVPNYLFNTEGLKNTLKDFNAHSKDNGNYYNAILQNLFFATLNKEIPEREFAKTKNRDIKTRFRYEELFTLSESEIIDYFKPIPFLNGGLFECLDKQDTEGNQYFLDGFSRNPIKFANGNFKHRAFIPNCLFFNEEKGIIPLLKRYNFTVEENAPNEVQVALDPELLGKVFENLLGAFNPETKETARKQSGSFYTPREIVEYMVNESLINYLQTKLPDVNETTLRHLFTEETLPPTLKKNTTLCQDLATQLKSIKILDPACGSGAFPMGILSKMVEVLEKLETKNQSIHNLKLHLIEECIYGIDIQTIATQISKLRFFITLVVEQDNIDLSKPQDNYGVLTLPNLETKFVSANTLIGIKKKKEGDFHSTLFTDTAIDDTKQELLNIRQQHFYANTAGAKKRLREQDAQLRAKLSQLLKSNKDFAPEDALQLSQWNPYDQNTSAPFFDMEWMFGIKEGFDVVIGNPPYVQIKGIPKSIKDFYKSTFKYAIGRFNLFYFFIEITRELCNKQCGKMREDLLINQNIIEIIAFNEQVFDSAVVDAIIFTYSNNLNNDDYLLAANDLSLKEIKGFEKIKVPYEHIFGSPNNQLDINYNETISNLIKKIRIDTKNYGEICNIKDGIIQSKIPDVLFLKEKTNNKCKKLLFGKNIERFQIEWDNNWVNYDIPKMKEIEASRNGGGLRMRVPGIFETNKILTRQTSDSIIAAFDESNFYYSNTLHGAAIVDEYFEPLYLLGVLNSNLITYYYRTITAEQGKVFAQIKIELLKLLPIKNCSAQNTVIDIVNKIQNNTENDINSHIVELNHLIYKLYNLTYKEVLIIDPEFSLTQEAYDSYKI